jgi:hypothetical protein
VLRQAARRIDTHQVSNFLPVAA